MDSQVQCVGFILDGNRRWAKDKGIPKLLGHKAGFEKLEECVRWVRDRGIQHMAAYVFSTENWSREKDEVAYLMDLYREMAEEKFERLSKEGVAVRFIGRLEMLPEDLQVSMRNIEAKNVKDPKITVWICISYGSRAEITTAAKALASSGEEVTEENLRKHFWSADMPDPDIIVRTSGEKRLSNFLLWQAAYSEFFFIQPHWPDFSEEILDEILEEYANRERRHGK
jgi:undecaprenyl diphosphate synthase